MDNGDSKTLVAAAGIKPATRDLPVPVKLLFMYIDLDNPLGGYGYV